MSKVYVKEERLCAYIHWGEEAIEEGNCELFLLNLSPADFRNLEEDEERGLVDIIPISGEEFQEKRERSNQEYFL